jgi:hypothetical protein
LPHLKIIPKSFAPAALLLDVIPQRQELGDGVNDEGTKSLGTRKRPKVPQRFKEAEGGPP